MASDKSKRLVERWVWVLVYGGLLALVLGMFLVRQDRALGENFQAVGMVVAGLGALLIWIRSLMK